MIFVKSKGERNRSNALVISASMKQQSTNMTFRTDLGFPAVTLEIYERRWFLASVWSWHREYGEAVYNEWLEMIGDGLHKYERYEHVVIGGDMNAVLGSGRDDVVGGWGLGERNAAGHLVADFLQQNRLLAMNTFFRKREPYQWTHVGTDGSTRQIDFIMTSRALLQTC
eukprot:873282-Heterocapsa_arctica.AAC.1